MDTTFTRQEAQAIAGQERARLSAKYPPRLVQEVKVKYQPAFEKLSKPSREKRYIKIGDEPFELIAVKETTLSIQGHFATLIVAPI